MLVLDASALLEWLLATRAGHAIHARAQRAAGELFAPHLIDVEVAHALRRLVRRGAIPETRGRAALESLGSSPLQRVSHEVLMPRVWALRENVTAYDAVYLALAEALRAPLLTRDAKLASIPGVQAMVEVV